jgi:hypothetical protein
VTISGYVLEPCRLGNSNSAYTASPDTFVYNQGVFNMYFPADESRARVEWMLQVIAPGKLHEAVWGWTMNQGELEDGNSLPFARFDYEGLDGRFKLLPGTTPQQVGVLALDSNTTRLKVDPLPLLPSLSLFPVRVSRGSDSGVTMVAQLVATDADLNNPDPNTGYVQISRATGNLGWAPADLAAHTGEQIRWQQQSFVGLDNLGLLGSVQDTLLLAPLPRNGQYPQIRLGYGAYLNPISKATDADLSANPAPGTVEWSRATGLLKFNSGTLPTQPVFYDGVLQGFTNTTYTTQGTVGAPTALLPIPSETEELYFRTPSGHQWATTQWCDDFGTGARGVVQVRRSDGAIQFSSEDVADYGAEALQAWNGQLLISMGVGVQVWRSQADLGGTNPSVLDAQGIVVRQNPDLATWADPIAQNPYVRLPIIPLEGPSLEVQVQQGTGSWVGPLPNQVTTPTAGYGYCFDYPNRRLAFCQHWISQIQSALEPYGAKTLAPLLVTTPTVELETFGGSGVWQALQVNQDFLVDSGSGVVTLTTQAGTLLAVGSGNLSGVTLTGTGFTSDMVGGTVTVGGQVGTCVAQTSTTLTLDCTLSGGTGVQYEVREPGEILADCYWRQVPVVDPSLQVQRARSLGAAQNAALIILPGLVSKSSLLVGGTSRALTLVPVLSGPGSVPAGQVEVLEATGELGFRTLDLGLDVKWTQDLEMGKDYRVQPELGFFEFTERFMALDEATLTYTPKDGAAPVTERARFTIRKEEVQSHPAPASTFSFNPTGKEVAQVLRVFRGGRPQGTGVITADLQASTVTFTGPSTATDALPSGPTVGPSERVLVDYQTYQALGGEKSLSCQQGPIQPVVVQLTGGEASFEVAGDVVSFFPAGCCLRIAGQAIYGVQQATYADSVTTITLESGQTFGQDWAAPVLETTSGALPLVATPGNPSYFQQVLKYQPAPKGSPAVKVQGDLVSQFPGGTLLRFWDGALAEYLQVEGSQYDQSLDLTTITLAWGVTQEYKSQLLYKTIRPVLPTSVAKGSTLSSPVTDQPFGCYRKIPGQPGSVLATPTDYKADTSGAVEFASPMMPGEQLVCWYTGYRIIEAGRPLRASYTHVVTPDGSNGLEGQVLKTGFTASAPDTFYFRVESVSNFQAELYDQYVSQAAGQSPSAGPTTDNSSAPALYEQGNPSLWFPEHHLSNEDAVAADTLLTYHQAIEGLEDALECLDGRLVGDHDGRFVYDGFRDNSTKDSWDLVTNQIDDLVKVSPAPYQIQGPPFTLVSVGTYLKAYQASSYSRFFPLARYGVTAIDKPASPKTGDPMGFWGWSQLTGCGAVQKRIPFCQVTHKAFAGTYQLKVDQAKGLADGLRPAFSVNHMVSIVDPEGVAIEGARTITVIAVGGQLVTVTPSLSVDIPAGSTMWLDSSDTLYRASYQVGLDLGVSLKDGLALYQSVQAPITNQIPADGAILEAALGTTTSSSAPFRFPALDGKTVGDDGYQVPPIVNPTEMSELGGAPQVGAISQQIDLTEDMGAIYSATEDVLVCTATMNGAGTIITLSSGTVGTLARGDLVRITSGANAGGSFRAVSLVTSGTSFQVDSPWPYQAGSFTITLGISGAAMPAGTGVFSVVSGYLVVTDGTADFVADAVKVGHTIIRDTGVALTHYQVTEVISGTQLKLSATTGAGTDSYRVSDSISTFGGPGSAQAELLTLLGHQYAYLTGEQLGVDQFLNTLLVTSFTGTSGEVVAAGTTLTDLTVDFQAADVGPGDYVHVWAGANQGFYRVASILSATQVALETPCPVTQIGVQYMVRRSSLVSQDSLTKCMDFQLQAAAEQPQVATMNLLVSTDIPVLGAMSSYARAWSHQDLLDWTTHQEARQTLLAGSSSPARLLEQVLAEGDRFYDKRYTWIDARINLETGLWPRRLIATATRVKAQEESAKALLKLQALG